MSQPYLSHKIDDVRLINHFGDCKWKLTKGSMIVARGKKEGTLYVMQGRICKGEANIAHGVSSMELWHRQLGHMSEKGLHILEGKTIFLM